VVMVTALVPASQVQPDLFDQQDRPRLKRMMAALDAVNARWGAGTLQYAASGLTKAWKMQLHRRSPAYTTNWDELTVVNA
jgi:DNA polymerase V